jgi:hypothetical protein
MKREIPEVLEEPDGWCVLGCYDEPLSAAIDAGFLRGEGIATWVEPASDYVCINRPLRLFVNADLVHRARWLLKLETVSEAELDFLATGELPSGKDGP